MGSEELIFVWHGMTWLLDKIATIGLSIGAPLTLESWEPPLSRMHEDQSWFRYHLFNYCSTHVTNPEFVRKRLKAWLDELEEIRKKSPSKREVLQEYPCRQNPEHSAYRDLFPVRNGRVVEFFELFRQNINELAATINDTLRDLPTIDQPAEHGFYYLGYDGEHACRPLMECFMKLRRSGLIHRTTNADDWRRVFTEYTPSNKLIWTGKKNQLKYFIKVKLCKDGIVAAKDHWKATAANFQIENKTTGMIMDIDPEKAKGWSDKIVPKYSKPVDEAVQELQTGIGSPKRLSE